MFITKAEFKTIIIPEILERLTNKDDSVLVDIITESIEEMKGFLQGANYNLAAFNATGNSRNKVLLKHLKRICSYELLKRKDHPVDQDTQNAYDETMTWLEKVAVGKMPVHGLAKNTTPGNQSGADFIEFGSNPKYTSNF